MRSFFSDSSFSDFSDFLLFFDFELLELAAVAVLDMGVAFTSSAGSVAAAGVSAPSASVTGFSGSAVNHKYNHTARLNRQK